MQPVHPRAAAAARFPNLTSLAPSFLALLTLSLLALCFLALFAFVPTAGAASGDLAWQRVLNGSGDGNDYFASAVPAPKGGVYAAGTTFAANSDVLVVRYDAAGQRLWLRTYNGSANAGDGASAAATDGGDNLIVAGTANTALVVIKYGPGGQRRWVRIYNDPESSQEGATGVAVDGTGAIYVVGYRVTASGPGLLLVKYGPDGVRKWVRTRAQVNAEVTRPVAVDAAGNVYVLSRVHGAVTGYDFLALKYDAAGHRRWVRRWNGPGGGDDIAQAVVVTAAGTAYVAGVASGISSNQDAVVIKYGTDGSLQWRRFRTSPGAFADGYGDIVLLANGDVVVCGETYGGAGHMNDALLVRLSPAGRTLWARLYNGPDGLGDSGAHVARGPAGAVYVTGNSYGAATTYDIVTLKYGEAGALRWARRYVGAGGSEQQLGNALTVNGGVYVAGFQEGVGSDATLLKYRP